MLWQTVGPPRPPLGDLGPSSSMGSESGALNWQGCSQPGEGYCSPSPVLMYSRNWPVPEYTNFRCFPSNVVAPGVGWVYRQVVAFRPTDVEIGEGFTQMGRAFEVARTSMTPPKNSTARAAMPRRWVPQGKVSAPPARGPRPLGAAISQWRRRRNCHNAGGVAGPREWGPGGRTV